MPKGLKVIDLGAYEQRTQEMVIAAVLEWVYRYGHSTITICPEAWEFFPRRKKRALALQAGEILIRKGAAEQNWLWIDSQDLPSVSPELLRQVQVWVFGIQRAVHEVRRTLDHIPYRGTRPAAVEVATLGVGEYFVAFQDALHKIYAAPAWMTETHAAAVARGEELASTGRSILRDLENARGA